MSKVLSFCKEKVYIHVSDNHDFVGDKNAKSSSQALIKKEIAEKPLFT